MPAANRAGRDLPEFDLSKRRLNVQSQQGVVGVPRTGSQRLRAMVEPLAHVGGEGNAGLLGVDPRSMEQLGLHRCLELLCALSRREGSTPLFGVGAAVPNLVTPLALGR